MWVKNEGCFIHLVLIICISFLYSGLLNVCRQGNSGFASGNIVLILHESQSFSNKQPELLAVGLKSRSETFPAGLTWHSQVIGTRCFGGAKSKSGTLWGDMFLKVRVYDVAQQQETVGMRVIGTSLSTVNRLHS